MPNRLQQLITVAEHYRTLITGDDHRATIRGMFAMTHHTVEGYYLGTTLVAERDWCVIHIHTFNSRITVTGKDGASATVTYTDTRHIRDVVDQQYFTSRYTNLEGEHDA